MYYIFFRGEIQCSNGGGGEVEREGGTRDERCKKITARVLSFKHPNAQARPHVTCSSRCRCAQHRPCRRAQGQHPRPGGAWGSGGRGGTSTGWTASPRPPRGEPGTSSRRTGDTAPSARSEASGNKRKNFRSIHESIALLYLLEEKRWKKLW